MARAAGNQDLQLIPLPAIQKRILVVRERHVMLDRDLAELYEVQTRALVQQVKRNIDRFPDDFMFQLSAEETAALRSQIVTSKGRGGRRTAPYGFTEQGVAMLSGVLRSRQPSWFYPTGHSCTGSFACMWSRYITVIRRSASRRSSFSSS